MPLLAQDVSVGAGTATAHPVQPAPAGAAGPPLVGSAIPHAVQPVPATTTAGAAGRLQRERAFALKEAAKIKKPEDFAIELLTYMGLPVSRANVKALLEWQSSEGVFPVNTPRESGYHNPLATGFLYEGIGPKTPHSSRPNLQAAQYPNWKIGIEATAFSLREHQYARIYNVLRRSEGGAALEAAVHETHWGTGPWSTQPLAPYTYRPYGESPFYYRGP